MIAMPEPDQAVLARRAEIVAALRRIVPGEGVIDKADELRAFECDGLTAYRQPPMVAVLPGTTAQVVEVLRYCAANGVKVVPRGAGTSLSGGALPLADGVLLGMGKFNRIREIDVPNRCVVAEPGVTNLGVNSRRTRARPLLRARPVQPDRLHHRRQRGRELRRRPLPEIRDDHQQRDRNRAGDDRGRNPSNSAASISTAQGMTCSA